jgi:hypothetical protein
MICTAVFGYSLNTVGSILQSIREEESKTKREREIITRFMIKRNIPRQLKDRVLVYLDYIQKQTQNNYTQDE